MDWLAHDIPFEGEAVLAARAVTRDEWGQVGVPRDGSKDGEIGSGAP